MVSRVCGVFVESAVGEGAGLNSGREICAVINGPFPAEAGPTQEGVSRCTAKPEALNVEIQQRRPQRLAMGIKRQ